jgi:hypothetical protein
MGRPESRIGILAHAQRRPAIIGLRPGQDQQVDRGGNAGELVGSPARAGSPLRFDWQSRQGGISAPHNAWLRLAVKNNM